MISLKNMNALFVVCACFVIYFLGYRFYAAFLSKKLFELNNTDETPAHTFKDGIDFVPTKKHVLFGHHYTSIAGAGPIVGPAIAVIWGWVPAVLWVVFGTLTIGAVHDFGCLVLSLKNQGRSIGDVTADIIGPRSRLLFLIVIFFLVWIVIAVFAWIIANLFVSYPQAVIPINFEIIVALAIGTLIHKTKLNIILPSLLALVSLYAVIFIGVQFPVHIPVLWKSEAHTWILLLLLYSFLASTLPVWLLLQPRDYINSHQLFVALGFLFLGLVISQPQIVAPAFNGAPQGAPPWFPFLFITIACGAISGFHGLVSSGTTSKQVNKMSDAPFIGYGGMIGESLLGLIVILAATAGFSNVSAWHSHYASWNVANSLNAQLGAFINGGAYFLKNGLNFPTEFSSLVIVVVIISFAATTLDTAVRIQRYIIQELNHVFHLKIFKNRFAAGACAALTPLLLVVGGNHWVKIWPIFGASNQLLGTLSLLVISVYLFKKRKNGFYTLIPMIFLSVVTFLSMFLNALQFYKNGNILLTSVSCILFFLALWIVLEGSLSLKQVFQKRRS